MTLEQRLRDLQARLGKAILVRGVHAPEPEFRGRIIERPRHIVIEYRDDNPGYFWDQDLLAELVEYLEQGRVNVTLLENDLEDEGDWEI